MMIKTSDNMIEQVFNWEKRVEVLRAQTEMLTSIQENKDFDTIKHMKPANLNMNMSNSQSVTRRRC